MTVAHRPEEFAFGDAPPGGDDVKWEVDGLTFEKNPRRLLTADDNEMMRIWHWTRVGDFGGARPLPDAGGIQDQAAVMMDAIRIMDGAYARLRKAERRS